MRKITRRQFLKKTAKGSSTLALSSLIGFTNSSCGRKKSPNLVFVFPDQMRGQAMGFLGEEPVITPNLDRFSKESAVFTNAVSNYPVCSPYRGMLMTGQYPHTNGVTINCNSRSAPFRVELKQDSNCWSDILKSKGYSLGYIGKWHLEAPYKPYVDSYNNRGEVKWNEWTKPDRRHGFDYWYAYNTYDRHMNPMYWDTYAYRTQPTFVEQWGPEHEADKAIKYINNEDGLQRDSKQPFALVVSMNPPHMPYDQLPQKYVDEYEIFETEELCKRPNIPAAGTKWGDYYRKHIKNYFAMVTGVDEQFGRILNALKENGLEENSIVVFTSDHGNCLGIHDMISKNNHLEESMRVPFLIRWPGKIKPRHDNLLFSVPDLYPTLLDLMGFEKDIPTEVEGRNYSTLFRTENGERPTSQLYLWVPLGKPRLGRRGVRSQKYTLMINNMPNQPFEIILSDREKDPFQLKNFADESPEIVSQLIKDELIPWLEKTNDPWWENTKSKLEKYL
jgi:arylsulfatase A-like enzyme